MVWIKKLTVWRRFKELKADSAVLFLHCQVSIKLWFNFWGKAKAIEGRAYLKWTREHLSLETLLLYLTRFRKQCVPISSVPLERRWISTFILQTDIELGSLEAWLLFLAKTSLTSVRCKLIYYSLGFVLHLLLFWMALIQACTQWKLPRKLWKYLINENNKDLIVCFKICPTCPGLNNSTHFSPS